MNISLPKIYLIMLVGLITVSSSCQVPLQEKATPHLPTSTATRALPTSTQAVTPTYTLTATPTPTPPRSPSATQRPYELLVSTAFYETQIPALPSAQARALVLDLFKTNAGCKLPCWWGITPGETEWSMARPFLAQFATGFYQGDLKYHVEQGVRYPITYVGVSYDVNGEPYAGTLFYLKSNIIESIQTDSIGTDINYRLHQLLSAYGQPDQVLLFIAHVPIDPLPANLVLIYGDFLAYYELRVDKRDEQGNLWICPTAIGPRLWMWSPENKPTKEAIREFTLGADPPRSRQLQSIEKVTNLTVNAFYELFKEFKHNNCVQTPESIWP